MLASGHIVFGFFLTEDIDSYPRSVLELLREGENRGSPVATLITGRFNSSEQGRVLYVPGTRISVEGIAAFSINPANLTVDPAKVEAFLARCRQVEGFNITPPSWLLCSSIW